MAERDRRIDLNDPSIGPQPRTELLAELLIDERRNVLFVGEGDFSFTVAFAALRQSNRSTTTTSVYGNLGTWDGIIATRYEPTGQKPAPVISEVKRSCVMNCLNSHSARTDPYIVDKLDALEMIDTSDTSLLWIGGIDARSLPRELTADSDVVWFQCPWDSTSVYELVRGFLLGTAGRIRQGRVVCVGITKHRYYVERYQLAGLLGNRHASTRGDGLDDTATTDTLRVYHFCGVDDMLIQQVLAYGYRHQGLKDIHDFIKYDHVTLVFCRK